MQLPNFLQIKIQGLIDSKRLKNLKEASFSLSSYYKEGKSIETAEQHLAYLAVRFPATFSSIVKTLSMLKPPFSSFLDLGAGPATGFLAASEVLPPFEQAIFVERDAQFIELGRQLTSCGEWIHKDIEKMSTYPSADLVLLSYAFGEGLSTHVIEKAWEATQKAFVFIEPGTPRGFHHLRKTRDLLIERGAYLLAPCPHLNPCPLKDPSWCHFSVRLERTFAHKYAKEGTLPYEDEKFCYLIATKTPSQSLPRILSDSQKRSSHVHLALCTQGGLK